jgi:hypothetical protein
MGAELMIRVFLSFVQEDLNLVNLFRGQAKNSAHELEFADYSLKQPFDSKNADYIGRGILEKIRQSRLTICLCGPTTYTSEWVNWELQKSAELGKPIMGVYLYSDGSIKYYPRMLENRQRISWNIPLIVSTMRQLAQS